MLCDDKRWANTNGTLKETDNNPVVSWLSSVTTGGKTCIQWKTVCTWLYNFSLLTFDYGCAWQSGNWFYMK